MPPIGRRAFVNSVAALGIASEVAVLASGCAGADGEAVRDPSGNLRGVTKNPYEFGAIGDGVHDDTDAFRAAYDSILAQGGGSLGLTRGQFFIPGHIDMPEPGVSIVGCGGAVIGGGELRIGPSTYAQEANGVSYAGDRVSGVIFDRNDDFGSSRCLVLRNVRGLDVSENYFRSGGKGIAVEMADGNDKFHTTAMLRVSNNRFAQLVYGIYADTFEWDRLSDWQVTDNFFNYCSDTSVWIAGTDGVNSGGIDGLNLSGNTLFSINHNESDKPLFSQKRYNIRLGKTNWLRIINNNFFEAGLSAIYLETPANLTFAGNHVAWPGQRELSDALEIHGGAPTAVIEANTFAHWTRAAIGFYDMSNLSKIEVGQNAWKWSADPNSWKGSGTLPGYRVFASDGGEGYPIIRDFATTGAHDQVKRGAQQSRDVKSPKGGTSGAFRAKERVDAPKAIFNLSNMLTESSFGGIISITATNAADGALVATYALFVSSEGAVCSVLGSGGFTDGADARYPSFTWAISGTELQASPVGVASDTYDFDAVSVGAVSLD